MAWSTNIAWSHDVDEVFGTHKAIDLRLQLEEQGEDLAAARATNRELMAQLNTTAKHR